MNIARRLILMALCSAACTYAGAQVTRTAADLEKYSRPGNAPAAPAPYTYAPDGVSYFALSDDKRTIDRYDIATGNKIECLFDIANTRETTIGYVEGFEVSENGRYILVYNETKPIYRRTFTATYYAYEVRSRLLKPLSRQFKQQQAPLISPDGRMIAFVAENNIYIKKLDYDSEVQVTKDGEKDRIINGVPDWVYEEEFCTTMSMAWAPDNLTLCYLKYNESEVPLYTLPLYQGTCDAMNQYALYPGEYTYKYPVAGQKNSKVTLHAYDVENRKITDITMPDSKIEYIPGIQYGGDTSDILIVLTLNRDQNHYEIYSVNPKSTVAKSIYTEDSKAWVDPMAYENIKLLNDGFLVVSSRTGYNHIYKYTYAGALVKAITSGQFDVTDSYGQDAKGNFYYQAASPSPIDRTVVKIDAKGVATVVSKKEGTSSASFCPDMSKMMLKYSDATTAPLYTFNNSDGKQLRVVEDNARYAAKYAGMPTKKFFKMQSDGYELNGYMILPENATGKLPVIMYQYSGPGSQLVLNSWSVDWENYFATQGYAVVCVDGRGSGGNGREFQDVVYKRLGYFETIDQINAAKYVATLPWADPNRIGIYGWSYGGYEALMAASATSNPYKAAVAIAPVTDFRFYDTVYAERYMLTPQQNEEGYRKSAPLNCVQGLKCPLLIMYGTADDNVHPQNSIQYVSKLQSIGGLCDMFIFPNMNHSIYGCNSRSVVYAKMLDFFNLRLK